MVTTAVVLCPIRTPVGSESRLITTAYELTLLDVVAVGAIVATLPVARAPVSALHDTLVTCPTLSLVASASAKLALICILVRSARAMKPELELELDELFAVELDELLFPLPPFPPFPPLPAELPVPLLEE